MHPLLVGQGRPLLGGQVSVDGNDFAGGHRRGEIGGDALLLGLGTQLGEGALVELVDARIGAGDTEGGALTVVVLEVGLGPFLVGGLARGQQVGVGRGAGGRHDLDGPEGLGEGPEGGCHGVDDDAHLEERAGDDEHQRHHVHHGALRLGHRVVAHVGHVAREGQAHGEELQADHEDDRGNEDGDDAGLAERLAQRVGERDAEDGGVDDLLGDGGGQGAEVVGGLAAVGVGAGGDRRNRDNGSVHAEEDGHLHEHRQAGGEGRNLVLALQGLGLFHHLLTADLVLLALVLLLDLAHFRLDGLHGSRGADLLEEQRDDGDAHQDGEQHDGQDPRHARAGRHSEQHEEVVDPDPHVGDRPREGVEDCVEHSFRFRRGAGAPLFRCSLQSRGRVRLG